MRRRTSAHLVLLALFWLAAISPTISTPTDLPHSYYEELRNYTATERLGNVDALLLGDKKDRIAMCHLVSYLGFSRASAEDCSDQKQAAKIYKELAATLLAIHHFNNGNGVVVPEIADIQERCPIRLSVEFHDSRYTPNVVVQSLTKLLANDDNGVKKPCAVIGARSSSSTGPSAIVSGVYDLPQMSFTATSPQLNDRFKYPYFSRVVPADDAAAQAAIKFLRQELHTTHLGVLYVNDPFGNNYNQALQRQADQSNITLRSFPLAFPPNPQDIEMQLQRLKDTGTRHVFMVFFSDHIEPVMSQAVDLDIVGVDYFWFLGISTSYFSDVQLEVNSPLAKALTGMGILPEFGAKPNSPGYHRFVQAWKKLTIADVDYFNSKMPPIRGHEKCYQAPHTFFQDNEVGSTAHFAYDTVMALGLGACAATVAASKGNAFAGFNGKQHTKAIVNTTFEGATGIVSLEPQTGSRDPLRFQYAILNVQPQPLDDPMMVSFTTPEAVVLTPNDELTDWKLVSQQPFLFADGTTTPPPSLPLITVEMNYIGNLVVFGYTCCAAILGLSIAFGVWTYNHRDVRVVKASQPFFLGMVCTGTLVLGSVLIPLSVDDQHFSPAGTDAACMSVPWLSSMGFVTAFSALASKTYRINQLHQNAMRLTRLKLSPWDVLKPFLLLTTANVIVLTCWTLLAPLHFVRMPDSGTDEWNRVVSSTGRCVHDQRNSGDSIPYMVALAVVNLSAVLFANVQAYRARNIHTEYSESRYIALIMLLLLQSWLTGIPVIGLVYDIPRASYVVVVLIVLLTSMAILLLVFVPKILHTQDHVKTSQTAASPRRRARSRQQRYDDHASSDGGDDWQDDKSDLEAGLKIYRASSTVPRDSRRQSYASVDGLEQYLKQSTCSNNDRRMNDASGMTGSLRHSQVESGDQHLRHSTSRTGMNGSNNRQHSSSSFREHVMEPLTEESSKEVDSNPSLNMSLPDEFAPDPKEVEQALHSIVNNQKAQSTTLRVEAERLFQLLGEQETANTTL